MIIKAVKEKNIEKVTNLIDEGEDVDARDEDGNSLLKIAVTQNDPEIVSLLIDNGASAKKEDNDSDLLRLAVEQRNGEIADLLFGTEGYPDKIEFLHQLIYERNYRLIENICPMIDDLDELFDAPTEWLDGVKLHDKDYMDQQSALQLASALGDLKSVQILISAGADPTFKQNDGSSRTALHKAVLSLNTSLIKFLIENGADIDAADCRDETPLCDLTRCFRFDSEESVTKEFKEALHVLLKFNPSFSVGYCSERNFIEDMSPGVLTYFLKHEHESDGGAKIKNETGITF